MWKMNLPSKAAVWIIVSTLLRLLHINNTQWWKQDLSCCLWISKLPGISLQLPVPCTNHIWLFLWFLQHCEEDIFRLWGWKKDNLGVGLSKHLSSDYNCAELQCLWDKIHAWENHWLDKYRKRKVCKDNSQIYTRKLCSGQCFHQGPFCSQHSYSTQCSKVRA